MYLVSAKSPQFSGFITFHPNDREKGIYMVDITYIHVYKRTYIYIRNPYWMLLRVDLIDIFAYTLLLILSLLNIINY